MIQVTLMLTLSAIYLGHATSTTSSIFSTFPGSFRTGEVTPSITTSNSYDLEVPFSSPHAASPIGLALSMIDYSQDVDASTPIYYGLYENTPSGSNSTHVVFQVYLGYPLNTHRAKVRYLTCPTSLFSNNFRIHTRVLTLGYSAGVIQSTFPLGFTFNLTDIQRTLWISGLSASANYYLSAGFAVTQLSMYHQRINSVRLTLVFVNPIVSEVSGFQLYHFRNAPSNIQLKFHTLLGSSSWQNLTNCICGLDHAQPIGNSPFEYTLTFSGVGVICQHNITWASFYYPFVMCFIAANSLCPSTHPYYLQDTYQCIDVCPSTEDRDYVCLPCPEHCQNCSSSTACSICFPGFYLRSDSHCYSFCLDGTYPNTTTQTCDSCPEGCATCTSLNLCQSCFSNYFLKSYFSDYKGPIVCDFCYLGRAVTGGCTQTQGCNEVIYYDEDATLGICIGCNAQFVLASSSCSCKQSSQVMVGETCSQFSSLGGCISAYVPSYLPKCLFCDLEGHFLYNSTSGFCDCESGYHISGTVCLQVCGDGVIKEDQCDDGNTVDGDGCSSTCQEEEYYKCTTSNNLSSSVCQYLYPTIDVSLVMVMRVNWENEVQFVFAFSPDILSEDFLAKHPLLSINSQEVELGNVSWSIKEGNLVGTLSFGSDIQSTTILANFTFNQLFIRHEPLLLNFTAQSNNTKLTFYENTAKISLFADFFLGLSFASLFLLFVCSWAHKMAGVQFLHTLQLIYYLQFVFKEYTAPLSSLQSLSLGGMSNLYWQTDQLNLQMKEEYQKIEFSSQATEYTILFLAIPALATSLGFTLYRIVSSYTQSQGREFILKIAKKVYNGLVFPIFLGFYLPYLLAQTTLSFRSVSSFSLPVQSVCFFSFLFQTVAAAVFTHQLQFLVIAFRTKEERITFGFRIASKFYIPVYILYWVVMTIVLWRWVKVGLYFELLSMLGISTLMLLFHLRFKTYRCPLDKIGSISNFVLQVAFLLLIKFRNEGAISSSYETDLVVCLGIAVLCLINFILSLARVIYAVYKKVKEQCQQSDETGRVEMKIARQESNMKQMMASLISKNRQRDQNLLQMFQSKDKKAKKEEREADPELQKLKEMMRENFRQRFGEKSQVVQQESKK